MANYVRLPFVCAIIFGLFGKAAPATSCPFCIGVEACETNGPVPYVPCTATIVNQTVMQLNHLYADLSAFTAPAKEYRCVRVQLSPPFNSNNIFAVRGCTAGTKSVCSEPTLGFNGNFSCFSDSGAQSLRENRHSLLKGLLLNMVVLISAFALSSC